MNALSINYPRISQVLFNEPWDISPAAHDNMVQLLEQHIAAGSPIPQHIQQQAAAMEDRRSDFRTRVQLNDARTVALVPVSGIMGKRLGMFEVLCGGGFDLAWLDSDIETLRQIDTLETVIFDIDSPGGMARASTDTAERIIDLSEQVRTIAYSDVLCASAGYKLAAACDEFYAAKGASVGCIGTYMAAVDSSKYYEKKGKRIEVVREGKYKAMGHPGKPLTDDELAFLQESVKQLDGQFKQFCRDCRGELSDEVLEGQTFGGEDALAANLIDGIYRDVEDLIAEVV